MPLRLASTALDARRRTLRGPGGRPQRARGDEASRSRIAPRAPRQVAVSLLWTLECDRGEAAMTAVELRSRAPLDGTETPRRLTEPTVARPDLALAPELANSARRGVCGSDHDASRKGRTSAPAMRVAAGAGGATAASSALPYS